MNRQCLMLSALVAASVLGSSLLLKWSGAPFVWIGGLWMGVCLYAAGSFRKRRLAGPLALNLGAVCFAFGLYEASLVYRRSEHGVRYEGHKGPPNGGIAGRSDGTDERWSAAN